LSDELLALIDDAAEPRPDQSNAIQQGKGGEHMDPIQISQDLELQNCDDNPWSIYRSYYQNTGGLAMEKADLQRTCSTVSSTGAECGSEKHYKEFKD
jgi:hypothetical protein